MSRLLGFVDDSPPWFSHTETKKTNGDSKRATQQVGGWIFPWNLKAGIFEKISRWFWNLSLGMWRDSVAIFVVSDFQFQWSFRSPWSACLRLDVFFFNQQASGSWTDERFTVVDGGKGQLAFHNPRYNRPSAQKAKIWRFLSKRWWWWVNGGKNAWKNIGIRESCNWTSWFLGGFKLMEMFTSQRLVFPGTT